MDVGRTSITGTCRVIIGAVPRILVLFAHPALEKSRVHRRLVARAPSLPHLTFHDLYEAYPDFDIDVPREQALLSAHDVVVFQHPLYWYSTPALIKQWEDLVLEHGWAYGSKGTALRGKYWLHVVSAGGSEPAYQSEGLNRHTVRELLAPLEQTARLCGMTFLPPWLIFGTHRMTVADIDVAADRYREMLTRLHDGRIDLVLAQSRETFNAALDATTPEAV